jgi:hypothetical protein
VLNAVMHVDVGKVKVSSVVRTVEDSGDVARYVKTERGCKVVRRTD